VGLGVRQPKAVKSGCGLPVISGRIGELTRCKMSHLDADRVAFALLGIAKYCSHFFPHYLGFYFWSILTILTIKLHIYKCAASSQSFWCFLFFWKCKLKQGHQIFKNKTKTKIKT
jgi:hypothetical protein